MHWVEQHDVGRSVFLRKLHIISFLHLMVEVAEINNKEQPLDAKTTKAQNKQKNMMLREHKNKIIVNVWLLPPDIPSYKTQNPLHHEISFELFGRPCDLNTEHRQDAGIMFLKPLWSEEHRVDKPSGDFSRFSSNGGSRMIFFIRNNRESWIKKKTQNRQRTWWWENIKIK